MKFFLMALCAVMTVVADTKSVHAKTKLVITDTKLMDTVTKLMNTETKRMDTETKLMVAEPKPLDIAEVYMSEDANGYYSFKVKSKEITRSEERDHEGKVLGSYTYVDPEGVLHEVTYVAAPDMGFMPKSVDLPVSVPETPEMLQLRAEHMAAVEADRALYPKGHPEEEPIRLEDILARLVVPEQATLPMESMPAEDEENVAARMELFAEYERVLARLAEAYKTMHH